MVMSTVNTSTSLSFIGLRKPEKKQIQLVSYIQNTNTSITSIIPTLATVLTFVVHTLLGLPLNTSDVSTTDLWFKEGRRKHGGVCMNMPHRSDPLAC